VGWYLRYALSYRDVEELMQEREVTVDHTTIFRWVPRYAEWSKYSKPLFAHGSQSRATPTGGSLRRLLGRFQPILQRQIRDPCEVFLACPLKLVQAAV
jgi:hypothetical protein